VIFKILTVRKIVVFIAFCCAFNTVFAQSNTSSVFRFLEVTPNAYASALGGNQTGLYKGDFSLLFLNPAYLSANASGSVSASYINFLGDANMGFTSAVYDVEGVGTFGAGIRFVGYGEFDELDENGNQLGTFHANDIAVSGAYSIPVFEKLRAGAGLDFIHSSYSAYKSSAVAVSAGLFYRDTTSDFSAGITVRNLGTQLSSFDEVREPLPLDISVGISKQPEGFPFMLSLTFKELNNWDMPIFGETENPSAFNNIMRHVLIGGETTMGENLYLRLGYDHYLHEQTQTGKNFDLAGIAFGIGFTIKDITFDLSRNSYSKLGGLTRFSVKTALF